MRYVVASALMLYGMLASATQLPLPTQEQLELRLADATMTTQRALCATLWHQGNEVEQQLVQLKVAHEALKQELRMLKEARDAPKPTQ